LFYFTLKNNIIKDTQLNTINKTCRYYIAGEVFEPNLSKEELYQFIKEGRASEFIGEYNILFEDEEDIYILADELGSIKWFYYFDGESFSISNNFWYLAKEFKLGVNDININSFYESILFYFPLNSKTFFKKIFVVPPGTIIIFSKSKKSLSVKKIKEVQYKVDSSIKKEDMFYNIDSAFNKLINKIIQHNKNIFLGLTISGGLDSRYPLFYTKRLKKIAYLIGLSNMLLKPLDLITSQKLAKLFNINIKLTNPFKKHSLEEKMLIDISRNPIGPSNFLKAVNKNKAFNKNEQFNLLITGAYGGLIGGRVLNDELLNSNIKELKYKMFYYYSSLRILEELRKGNANFSFLRNSFNKLLYHFTILKKPSVNYNTVIKKFQEENFLIPIENKKYLIESFQNFFKEDKDNLSNIMTFHLYRHSIRGAFESLHGQVKAYSIYYPYIYELSKTWKPEWLKSRALMEEFIFWKDKESSKIPLQNFDLPLNIKLDRKQVTYIKKILYKMKYFISFVLRGLVINYNRWWQRKSVQKYVNFVLNDKVESFDKIFNEKDIKRVFKYKRYNLILEHLIKLKVIIKIIENKDYDKLIKIDITESSKY